MIFDPLLIEKADCLFPKVAAVRSLGNSSYQLFYHEYAIVIGGDEIWIYETEWDEDREAKRFKDNDSLKKYIDETIEEIKDAFGENALMELLKGDFYDVQCEI